MKPISLYVSNGSLYRNNPKINWKVGVIKNNIPEGPNPARWTPLTKKNNGITVIGPANIKINIKDGLEISKSLKLLIVII